MQDLTLMPAVLSGGSDDAVPATPPQHAAAVGLEDGLPTHPYGSPPPPLLNRYHETVRNCDSNSRGLLEQLCAANGWDQPDIVEVLVETQWVVTCSVSQSDDHHHAVVIGTARAVDAGGVELHELKVLQRQARTRRHRGAVAGARVRARRRVPRAAVATRREHRVLAVEKDL